MKKLIIGLAASIGMATSANASTVLSENFESGLGVFTPSGQVATYTGTDYIPCCGTSGSASAMSNHFASFGAGNQPSGTLTTAFNTLAGEIYHLSFDYGALGNGTDALSMSLPDYALTFTFFPVANNNMDTTFQTATFDILGNGGAITLQFTSAGTDNVDAILDNVLITDRFAPGVPEPATWAMMLLGFGAMGMALRRRRVAQVA
jgi:hypothetical protein